MAVVDPAAKRAFLLCDRFMRKIAPSLKVDPGAWTGPGDWGDGRGSGGGGGGENEGGGGSGHGNRDPDGEGDVDGDEEIVTKMDGLDDMVDGDGVLEIDTGIG